MRAPLRSRATWFRALALASCAVGCATSPDTSSQSGDAIGDGPDGATHVDAGTDVTPDVTLDVTPDGSVGDTIADTSADTATAVDSADGTASDTSTPSDGGVDATTDLGPEVATTGDAGPLSATVANLRDGMVLESGFVVGAASGTALSAVNVSIDGGATWSPATGTTSWSYRLPVGTATWATGSKHTIWVEATDGVNVSTVTKLSVTAGPNHDVNGDGYADLAVGSPCNLSSGTGFVFLYDSTGAKGIANGAHATTTLTGQNTDFGNSVALADMNSDGYADVVTGDDSAAGGGAVYVFHSAGAAGVASATYAAASVTITGPASAGFGYGVPGDVNGDGFPDLILGVPSTNSYAGALLVFQSSGAEIVGGASTTATVTIAGAAGSGLGSSIAIGDVNGDGHLDVLAGAGRLGASNGAAYVYTSLGSAGLVGATTPTTTLTGTTPNAFGDVVTLADVNGDGYADAVVSAYLLNTGSYRGAVYVFPSAGTTGIPSASDFAAPAKLSGAADSGFGVSVAAADLDGDGYADVVVGENTAAQVYVFKGSSAGVATTSCPTEGVACAGAVTLLIGPTLNALAFGYSVFVTDLAGDAYPDLVVGAPPGAVGNPGVYIYPSTGSAGVASGAYTTAASTLTYDPSWVFGQALN
ncbi:MAG: FG-GAP-like repeat-containing protein [Polyangiales bacterium]